MLPPPPSVFSRAPAEQGLGVGVEERGGDAGFREQPALVLVRHIKRPIVGIEHVVDVIEEEAFSSWSTRYRTASNFAGGWAGKAEGTLCRLRFPKGSRAVVENEVERGLTPARIEAPRRRDRGQRGEGCG